LVCSGLVFYSTAIAALPAGSSAPPTLSTASRRAMCLLSAYRRNWGVPHPFKMR
jgi:hypothetical protein